MSHLTYTGRRARGASGPVGHRSSFRAFLLGDAYRLSKWQVVDEVHNRMLRAEIKTRDQLLRWVRENYPHHYRRYHLMHGVTGREATERLWADFTRWRDWCDFLGPAAP